jgi:acyl carrier protein
VSEADVKQEMRAFVEENFLYLHPGVELGDEDRFLERRVIDSLGFVELVEEVQSRYGLTVEDLEITEDNFGSIGAIARFVATHRNGN